MDLSQIALILVALSIFSIHAFLGYRYLKLKGHDSFCTYVTLILSSIPIFWFAWGCTNSKYPSSKTRNWTWISLAYGSLGMIYNNQFVIEL